MRITGLNRAVRTRAVFLLLAASTASGCASNQDVATPIDTGPAQPVVATYDCGEAGKLTVQAAGDAVRIVDAEGTELLLPAAPPNQNSRYGEGANAIVIEGREALYMHGRHPPIPCTR